MNKARIVGLVAGLIMAGSATAAAPDTAKIGEAIKADVHSLIAQFNAGDVDKAVGHDAPNYVGMMHGMPNVNGAAEDEKVTKDQVSDPLHKVAASNEVVDVSSCGDMAVYRATYAYTFTDPATKKPTTEHGNWVIGYKVQPDKSWKMAWSVVSDTGPAPAAK